jgi:hypothetical protein
LKKSSFILFLFSILIIGCTQGPQNIDPAKFTDTEITPYTDLGYSEIQAGSVINFFASRDNADIYYDTTGDINSLQPSSWTKGSSFIFDPTGDIKIFVKDLLDGKSSAVFERVYSVIPPDRVYMPLPSNYMKTVLINSGIDLECRTDGALIYNGYNPDIDAAEPVTWNTGATILLDNTGDIKIFAKAMKPGMLVSNIYSRVLKVVSGYPPSAGRAGTDAIFMEDASLLDWADGYTDYLPGSDCDIIWRTPGKAVGKASGSIDDIVSLGNGGQITMFFCEPIKDKYGPDLAVFENAFNDTFLELSFVEVSTNGSDFVRFDCHSLTSQTESNAGNVDATKISGLAGKYRMGYGTPFDLSELSESPDVINGKVDLANVRFIRLIDIIGDGSAEDSFGNPIYDPYPCTGSAGFDLDAIGALNE